MVEYAQVMAARRVYVAARRLYAIQKHGKSEVYGEYTTLYWPSEAR